MNQQIDINVTSGIRKMSLLLALAFYSGQPAVADEVPAAFEMSVVKGQAHGSDVIAGAYDAAIDDITSDERLRKNSFAVANNLCVAYTMTMEFEKAEQACDAALSARSRVHGSAQWYTTIPMRNKLRDKAVALSNRGVLRAVSGDAKGAREDFTQSLDIAVLTTAAGDNLARLDAKVQQAASLQ
jgi:hypothetical protein